METNTANDSDAGRIPSGCGTPPRDAIGAIALPFPRHPVYPAVVRIKEQAPCNGEKSPSPTACSAKEEAAS